MNRTVAALATGVLATGLYSNAYAQNQTTPDSNTPTTCSLETLKGTYIFSSQGLENGKPLSASGMMSFDGTGKLVAVATRSIEQTKIKDTGTYTLDENCFGTWTLASGARADIYVGPTGEHYYQTRVDQNTSAGGEARRVSDELIVK